VRAARVGETRTVLSQDAYGNGPVRRTVVGLRGLVQSGNSGGPVVNGAGRVVATVFAATLDGPRGGYGIPNATVRAALRDGGGVVSTGPCAR
jgi:S1-C subfamily serine protease